MVKGTSTDERRTSERDKANSFCGQRDKRMSFDGLLDRSLMERSAVIARAASPASGNPPRPVFSLLIKNACAHSL